MADISVQKKEGSDLTWVWAAAAVLAIAGLMFWLVSTQEPATVATVPEAEPAAESTAEATDLAAIGAAPGDYVGREVEVAATVTSILGNRSFWADVPGANPFLVIVGPAVADVSWIQRDASRTVVGSVQPLTEAEIDQWIAAQVLQADARPQMMIATHYLNVSAVQ